MATAARISVDEFYAMPASETDARELVDGELVPLPAANPEHSFICVEASYHLRAYLRANPVGRLAVELDCLLNSGSVRRPDLAVYMFPRAHQIDPRRVPVPFPPDIALEVLSPTESAIELNRKVRDYLTAGVREVWMLDASNGAIQVRTSAGLRELREQDLLDTPLLPGFAVPAAEILSPRVY